MLAVHEIEDQTRFRCAKPAVTRIAIVLEPSNLMASSNQSEVTELRRQLESQLEWLNFLDTTYCEGKNAPHWKMKSFVVLPRNGSPDNIEK